MGWETSNGQPVSVEATGLYIDGEFLTDEPPLGTSTEPASAETAEQPAQSQQ